MIEIGHDTDRSPVGSDRTGSSTRTQRHMDCSCVRFSLGRPMARSKSARLSHPCVLMRRDVIDAEHVRHYQSSALATLLPDGTQRKKTLERLGHLSTQEKYLLPPSGRRFGLLKSQKFLCFDRRLVKLYSPTCLTCNGDVKRFVFQRSFN